MKRGCLPGYLSRELNPRQGADPWYPSDRHFISRQQAPPPSHVAQPFSRILSFMFFILYGLHLSGMFFNEKGMLAGLFVSRVKPTPRSRSLVSFGQTFHLPATGPAAFPRRSTFLTPLTEAGTRWVRSPRFTHAKEQILGIPQTDNFSLGNRPCRLPTSLDLSHAFDGGRNEVGAVS